MKFDERSPEEWRRSAEPPLRRVSGAQVTTQSGYFAGAGSGTTAPLFGCGFINSVSTAPAMSRMPAVMKEDL